MLKYLNVSIQIKLWNPYFATNNLTYTSRVEDDWWMISMIFLELFLEMLDNKDVSLKGCKEQRRVV